MVAQADPVPLGVVEVDGPPGPVHHEDARGLEAVLPRAPLARGDPERDEVEARLAALKAGSTPAQLPATQVTPQIGAGPQS